MGADERNRFQLLAIFSGLIFFLGAAPACSNFIEVVPRQTSTPVPPAPTQPAQTTEPQPDAPSRIVAGAIDLDAPVVAMGWSVRQQEDRLVSQWDMPENEAAWHKNSARLGQGSNIVISGHNASTGGQVFAALDELEVGDEIQMQNEAKETFIYQVAEKNIVRTFANSAESQNYLRTVTQPTETEQLTLITCWPRWTNTHRLVVIARLTSKPESKAADASR